MASGIEFFTGFEGCALTGDLHSLFSYVGHTSYCVLYATKGFNNGNCLRLSNSSYYVSRTCVASKTKATGAHLNETLTNATTSLLTSMFSFVGPDIRIINYSSTELRVYRVTTLIGTGSTIIPSALCHVEVKVFSDTVNGTVEIKLNGAIILSLVDVNTGGQDITAISLGTPNAPGYLDNFYIANDFQGELVSLLMRPSSDTSVQFAPSTGTDNYTMIMGNDGDTTYVQSDTLNHKDLYGFEDLPAGYTPKAISLVTVARKDDAGARGLTPIIKHDSAEYDQAEATLATAYPATAGAAVVRILDEAPDATEWTAAKVNALQAGFKVST